MTWEQSTNQEQSPVTLEAMDNLIREYQRARAYYEEKKKAASEAHNQLEELEQKVVATLKAAGKSNYQVDGVGKVSYYVKETYTIPRTIEDKTRLFNYIKEKYGADTLMTMVGINHQTLNSFANKETEEAGVMSIPGLQPPTGTEVLSFRKE